MEEVVTSGEPNAAVRISDLLKRKLEQARDLLIDRNLRNKLVNCSLTSKRSKQIRVVDELPDEVFKHLLSSRREMVFAAGRGVDGEDGQERDIDFAAVWTPPEDDKLEADGVAMRHRDNALQTQLTAEGLQKRLTGLYYESREVEEEQGVNVLYLALGFLKWFEDGRSDVERYAPLLLLPVELLREGARDRFRLKIRDEDLFTNVSLKVWLSEQHSIQLPDLPESDEWLPSQYFESVRRAICNAARWEVLDREILLSFFSFSKFLLWRDLDPSNWPTPESVLGHGILKSLLVPNEESGIPESAVIPDDGRIDSFFKAADQVYVLDADSSQSAAIQTVLAGRNVVIQGPPGTGKSQTIANLIGAAVHQGKSVLFLAEKMAALQVVYERLKSVGLGPMCLELHSRKASKQQVLAQLREAIEAPVPPGVPGTLCQQLDAVTGELWAHTDRLHKVHEPGGHVPFKIIGSICRLRDIDTPVPDFNVRGADTWTADQISAHLGEIEQLAGRLQLSGVPARHPWRGAARAPLNPLDGQRLEAMAVKFAGSMNALEIILRSVWPLVRPPHQPDFKSVEVRQLLSIAKALLIASEKPDAELNLLCDPRWATDLGLLNELVTVARRLSEIRQELSTVFVDSAWERDWVSVRQEIAGHGQELFRFLRRPYREALRTYRSLAKPTALSTYKQRVASIDLLVEGQGLRSRLSSYEALLSQTLGLLWTDLPHSWERLARLADWLSTATALEPALSVRNARLLNWSEAPNNWSNRLTDVRDRAVAELQDLTSFVDLNDKSMRAEDAELAVTVGELSNRCLLWRQECERFNEWPPVRVGLLRLRELTDGDFYLRVYRGDVPPEGMLNRFHLAVLEQIWNAMCRTDQELAQMDGRVLDRKVEGFRELDTRRVEAAAIEIEHKHNQVKPTGSVGEMGTIRTELNKSRRLLPVRRLLENAGNAIQMLKPLFLMSPLSVAQYLAPGRLKFDLLLIDEASQIRPEDALGAVARVDQVAVVGDAKQLPPTNFFNRVISDGDGDGDDGETDEANSGPIVGTLESILALCDSVFSDNKMLKWHYRSQHPALIAVSNRRFYDSKLLLPPSVERGGVLGEFGLRFHRTPPGGYDRGGSRTNVIEAELVADAVCDFARKYPDRTLGIGTFSVAQRDAIRDLIDDRRRNEPALEPFFSTSRDEPFFVKNLESIQGDERDTIFISVGYGRDRDGRLTRNFGPIGKDGGERRLNVLISRARERCEVFSPITADDINTMDAKPGVVAFKEFLQFAEKGYFDVPLTNTGRTFDSDFEESVAVFLRDRGYSVDPQVGMAGFFVDLGVIDPANDARYLLGIECDGATYHSSRSARDRDRIRQQILEARGWKIYRIWSTDWFHRRGEQERKLLDVLGSAKEAVREAPQRKKAMVPPKSEVDSEQIEIPVESLVKQRNSAPYREADFLISCPAPPHSANPAVVHGVLVRILEIESPVHEEELARRVASVWGLERAGSRIQDTTQTALAALRRKGTVREENKFWSLVGANALTRVRDRSMTKSLTLRRPEYLPRGEVTLAAVEVLRANVRVGKDDLLAQMARLFGFQRTGQELQSAFCAVLDSEIGKSLLCDDLGYFMLNSANA